MAQDETVISANVSVTKPNVTNVTDIPKVNLAFRQLLNQSSHKSHILDEEIKY